MKNGTWMFYIWVERDVSPICLTSTHPRITGAAGAQSINVVLVQTKCLLSGKDESRKNYLLGNTLIRPKDTVPQCFKYVKCVYQL